MRTSAGATAGVANGGVATGTATTAIAFARDLTQSSLTAEPSSAAAVTAEEPAATTMIEEVEPVTAAGAHGAPATATPGTPLQARHAFASPACLCDHCHLRCRAWHPSNSTALSRSCSGSRGPGKQCHVNYHCDARSSVCRPGNSSQCANASISNQCANVGISNQQCHVSYHCDVGCSVCRPGNSRSVPRSCSVH